MEIKKRRERKVKQRRKTGSGTRKAEFKRRQRKK
jgi:hypothetical protein